MFKISEVTIDGFWQTFRANANFREDVNIIIGKNGTGKTTFLNILHAILTVDLDELYDSSFESALIKMTSGKRTRTIRAKKIENPESSPYPYVVYQISGRNYFARLAGSDYSRGYSPPIKKRFYEESQHIRQVMSAMVSLASLSVYRTGTEIDPDSRERQQRNAANPVDLRLNSLMQRLTHYQLELSNKARTISSELQRDVLTSLLYEKGKGDSGIPKNFDFDKDAERRRLLSTYAQLGVTGTDITKKIDNHVEAVFDSTKKYKSFTATRDIKLVDKIDFAAIQAQHRTSKVVEMSLLAEEKINEVFNPIDLFIQTLEQFVSQKKFKFEKGDLVITQNESVPIGKLSSGEKQLLILLTEALLQKQEPYIYLADEPELSLHITWQRNIISAIRGLNPNAQVIVGTHSPEIAGKFRESILDMESLLHAQS